MVQKTLRAAWCDAFAIRPRETATLAGVGEEWPSGSDTNRELSKDIDDFYENSETDQEQPPKL